jgi:hypothetical protein
MSYIFLDESGDLGFDFSKTKTTKYFMVTLLFSDKKRPIERIIRDIHRGLRKKYKMRDGMIHARKEEPATCARICKRMAENDCRVMTIYLNKKRVYTKLQNEKAILYNYIVNILLDRILTRGLIDKNGPIILVASRRETNKFLNLNFVNYLKQRTLSNHKLDIGIKIKTPFEEKGLQAADVLSWAIFRKYEYGDDSYYNVIRKIIAEESPLFP